MISNIITGSISLVGKVIKYSIYTGLTVGVITGGMAYMTKPTDSSFEQFLGNKVEQGVEEGINEKGSIRGAIAAKIVSIGTKKILKIEIKDMVFFKIGIVSFGGKEEKYIGVFQHWVN